MPDGRDNNGRSPGSLEVLRKHAIKPGEVKNKTGMNGFRRAQERFRKFALSLNEKGEVRDDRVLLAFYASALIPGPKGAPDRRLWMEQLRGRARQQIDLSNVDGTLRPGTDAIFVALQTAIAAHIDDVEVKDDGTPSE